MYLASTMVLGHIHILVCVCCVLYGDEAGCAHCKQTVIYVENAHKSNRHNIGNPVNGRFGNTWAKCKSGGKIFIYQENFPEYWNKYVLKSK